MVSGPDEGERQGTDASAQSSLYGTVSMIERGREALPTGHRNAGMGPGPNANGLQLYRFTIFLRWPPTNACGLQLYRQLTVV